MGCRGPLNLGLLPASQTQLSENIIDKQNSKMLFNLALFWGTPHL